MQTAGEVVAGEVVLTWASYRRRVIGFMIDIGLLLAALTIVTLVLSVMGVSASLLFSLYPIGLLLRDVFTNRSIGKRAMGLYIVRAEDGSTPSKGALVLRNVLLLLGPIELLCLAVQKEGRRLGDLAAETIVVSYEDRPRKQRNTKKRLILLASGFLVFAVILIGGIMLIFNGSGALDKAKEAARQDTQIQARVGEVTGFGLFPSGSISMSNGEGDASLRFKVKGTKGSVYVFTRLHKEDYDEWEIVFLRIDD